MQDKIRYPRVERYDVQVIEEDANANSWAVSYSDFLMTLLCFFVLFFSLDESSQSTLLLKISQSFKGSTQGFEVKTEGTTKISKIEAIFNKNLADLNFTITKDKQSLIIHLPDNLFEVGKYDLLGTHNESLQKIFASISDYKQQINLYFEGHTDDKPLNRQVSSIVLDNYLLGSLRAASALKVARSQGFSEQAMFIQTTSSYQRNSRSLSIKIEPKEHSQ